MTLSFVIAICTEWYRGVPLFEVQTGGVRIEVGGREYQCGSKEEAKAIIDSILRKIIVVN